MNIIEFANKTKTELTQGQSCILKSIYKGSLFNEDIQLNFEEIKFIKDKSKSTYIDWNYFNKKINEDKKIISLILGRAGSKSFLSIFMACYELYRLSLISNPEDYFKSTNAKAEIILFSSTQFDSLSKRDKCVDFVDRNKNIYFYPISFDMQKISCGNNFKISFSYPKENFENEIKGRYIYKAILDDPDFYNGKEMKIFSSIIGSLNMFIDSQFIMVGTVLKNKFDYISFMKRSFDDSKNLNGYYGMAFDTLDVVSQEKKEILEKSNKRFQEDMIAYV